MQFRIRAAAALAALVVVMSLALTACGSNTDKTETTIPTFQSDECGRVSLVMSRPSGPEDARKLPPGFILNGGSQSIVKDGDAVDSTTDLTIQNLYDNREGRGRCNFYMVFKANSQVDWATGQVIKKADLPHVFRPFLDKDGKGGYENAFSGPTDVTVQVFGPDQLCPRADTEQPKQLHDDGANKCTLLVQLLLHVNVKPATTK